RPRLLSDRSRSARRGYRTEPPKALSFPGTPCPLQTGQGVPVLPLRRSDSLTGAQRNPGRVVPYSQRWPILFGPKGLRTRFGYRGRSASLRKEEKKMRAHTVAFVAALVAIAGAPTSMAQAVTQPAAAASATSETGPRLVLSSEKVEFGE